MKVTSVEPILVGLPYDHYAPLPTQGWGAVRKTMDILFVKVTTDSGLVGWGEAFSNASGAVTYAAIEKVFGPAVIGKDATDIPALMLDLGRRYQSMTRNGPGGFALSGIDMALWDIAGKAAQKPVYELLGGKKRSKVPVYASLMRVVKPDLVKNLCLKTLDLGYRYIKLHEHTGEAVAAARAAIGPKIPLMVDVNCHWLTVEDCLKEARKMQPSDVYWLEEPLYPPDDLVGLVRLRKEAGMPLAMGENLGNLTEYQRVADAAAVDYVQPSVAKMGGISGLVKTMAYVELKGLKAIPHSPYVGPALIATLQVLAAHKNELVCEHRSVALEAHPIGDCVVSKDGYLKIPEGPGLGFEVDEDLVRKYRLPV